jgi:hypothetical protein
MYEIKCYDLAEMATLCSLLIKEGICFKADTNTMKITLTGGY